MRLQLLVLVAGLVSRPLAAQSNAERIANDHYSRSHDYDLVHQRIEVGNFNWDSTSFDGRVTTTLVARRAGLDSIVLDAGAKLVLKSVAAKTTLRIARHGDTLVVYLPKPIGFGDTARFTITYHGVVESGHGLTYIDSEGRPHRPRQIWSQGEDHDNHYWFPTYDFPNDKMTWDLVATVPKGMTAVSNGRLVSHVGDTFTWLQDKPSATYLVSLIVAPLAKVHDSWRGVPVDYYVYHEDSALARPLFRSTPDMIDTYSRLTGVNYPWAKYAQTTVADFFGGMENVSATTLVDWLPGPRNYQDRPWYLWILIPHELSHQWFGDYVTTENWANMWLNEGFAEFMPGQYWLHKQGARAEEDYYLDEYRQFMQIDHDERMPLAAHGSNNIYPKGALVLEMLKHYLGEQRFWASVHRYLTDHAFDNATTDDMRQAVLDATGENLDWFWDQWMYQAGYPEFAVTAKYDSSAATVTLVVQQTQQDSSKADSTGLRYTTPQVFRMPVDIRVGTATGDVTARAELSRRQDTVVVRGVKSAPTMIVFDDGDGILKRLTFEQPTAWLATQLDRDPNLWNRQWVIEQLSQRAGDSVAVAALARAATKADYFLIRAAAVGALADLPAAVALPPLQVAMKDTSAEVRAAAVEALGGLSGAAAQVAPLARDAWMHDSSDAVRGAAVTTLALSDSASRRAVILEALRTPSYRDAIQIGGYRAVVRSGDTTLIDTVDAHAGDQRFALHALAALAGRGNAHALDLLSKRLDDERPYVRRWAVEAFRFSLPRTVAQPKLQAIGGTLKFADTRQAVSDLLQQWR